MMRTTDRSQSSPDIVRRRTFFAAFQHRDFRFLWSALVCTTFIQRMEGVVLGWLNAAIGGGALLGSLFMINFGARYRSGPTMLLGTLLWSFFQLLLAFTPRYEMALVVLTLSGMAQAVGLTSMTLMLLGTSSSDMRGRMMGLRSLAIAPLFLGSLLSGALAEQM